MNRGRHSSYFILHPSSFILAILAVAAGAQIAAVHPGHQWGDDFALYILHARNIVEGRPYADTGYLYNPATAIVGPPSYPPLTSWLLAPVYALICFDVARPNFAALKAVMVACKLLELLILALSLRRELRLGQRVALLALLGLNHFTLHSVDSVLSEPPFEMLLYLDLWLIQSAESAQNSGRRLMLFGAAGPAAYLAYAARAVGLVLAIALAVTPLLQAGMNWWRRRTHFSNFAAGLPKFGAGLPTPPKRPTAGLPEPGRPAVGGVARSETGHNVGETGHDMDSAVSPGGGFIGPALAGMALFTLLALLQGAWLSSPRQYGGLFHQSTFRLLPQTVDYLARWSAFWSNGYANHLKLAALPLFAAWMVLALMGFVDCLRRRLATREVFFVLYLATVFVWPSFAGERLLGPIFPLWLFYGLRGLDQPWLAARAGLRRAVVGLLLVACVATYTARLVHFPWKENPEGVSQPQARQLFEYVRTQTDPAAVVVFVKPRAMALLGQRRSSSYAMPADDKDLWSDLKRMGATHLVVVLRDATLQEAAQPGQLPYFRQFVDRNRPRLHEVFANPDFAVWQMRWNESGADPQKPNGRPTIKHQ